MTKRRQTTSRPRRRTGRNKPAPSILHERLTAKRGLASEIAAKLGVNRGTVWMWSINRVPAEYVRPLGKFLRIAQHRLRPDLHS